MKFKVSIFATTSKERTNYILIKIITFTAQENKLILVHELAITFYTRQGEDIITPTWIHIQCNSNIFKKWKFLSSSR